jgi:tRNA C32,U32 (ribose-2'-O)-methylase TrmJ
MVQVPVFGLPEGVPFPRFGRVLLADQDRDALVAGVEEVTRAIVGAMSDKEYLTRRSESGTMPRLNRVFEELGIHHEEHVVPPKVLASIEKKKQKAAAKIATVATESKKRKGQAGSKALSKK